MQEILTKAIEWLVEVLPRSPFTDMLNQIGALPYLGWLNWFFPVRACLAVMAAWLGAMALYLLYSVVMRWLKVIGD